MTTIHKQVVGVANTGDMVTSTLYRNVRGKRGRGEPGLFFVFNSAVTGITHIYWATADNPVLFPPGMEVAIYKQVEIIRSLLFGCVEGASSRANMVTLASAEGLCRSTDMQSLSSKEAIFKVHFQGLLE